MDRHYQSSPFCEARQLWELEDYLVPKPNGVLTSGQPQSGVAPSLEIPSPHFRGRLVSPAEGASLLKK